MTSRLRILQNSENLKLAASLNSGLEIALTGTPIKSEKFSWNTAINFTKNENGEKYLHFVESTAGQRTDHYIADGEVKIINTTSVGFNTHSPQGINIIEQNGKFILETNEDGSFFVMKEQRQGLVFADSVQELNLLSLYTLQGLQFVVPELAVAGSFETISGEGGQDQLIVDVFAKDLNGEEQTKRLYLNGTKFSLEAPQYFTLAGLNFRMSYGSKLLDMPFAVKLRDFQLDKYPGSESPKSYASDVTVLDGKNVFDFRIFMNNINKNPKTKIANIVKIMNPHFSSPGKLNMKCSTNSSPPV